MSQKNSMTDAAFAVLSNRNKEIEFAGLWQEVVEMLGIPEEDRKRKKVEFYQDLMLDQRIASLKGNLWDLRNRRTFNELHAKAALAEEIEDEEEEETIEEEDESPDVPKGEETY